MQSGTRTRASARSAGRSARNTSADSPLIASSVMLTRVFCADVLFVISWRRALNSATRTSASKILASTVAKGRRRPPWFACCVEAGGRSCPSSLPPRATRHTLVFQLGLEGSDTKIGASAAIELKGHDAGRGWSTAPLVGPAQPIDVARGQALPDGWRSRRAGRLRSRRCRQQRARTARPARRITTGPRSAARAPERRFVSAREPAVAVRSCGAPGPVDCFVSRSGLPDPGVREPVGQQPLPDDQVAGSRPAVA